MKFKSNAKWNQPKEEGSVFQLKDNSLGIYIHRIIHIDDTWFLTCNALNISRLNLHEKNFEKAVKKSKIIINKKLGELMSEYDKICSDNVIEFEY